MKYWKWALKTQKSTLLLALFVTLGGGYMTYLMLQDIAYYPLFWTITYFIVIIGATLGLWLQPYTIYRKLKKMGKI
jgi:hypothetical protein